MKNLILILSLLVFIVSCGNKSKKTEDKLIDNEKKSEIAIVTEEFIYEIADAKHRNAMHQRLRKVMVYSLLRGLVVLPKKTKM